MSMRKSQDDGYGGLKRGAMQGRMRNLEGSGSIQWDGEDDQEVESGLNEAWELLTSDMRDEVLYCRMILMRTIEISDITLRFERGSRKKYDQIL